jgi:hypothetical protein
MYMDLKSLTKAELLLHSALMMERNGELELAEKHFLAAVEEEGKGN